MSWLSQLFHGGKNPAEAASPYLNQIPGVGREAYDPYIQQGKQAGETLGGEYGKMLDPQAFLDKLQGGYKPSEGYQFKHQELERGLGNTAASGGFAGTPMHQQAYGEMTDKLLSGDMQEYLQNALGIYGQGIAGEQGMYDKGFQSSGSLADFLGNNLTQQGGLAFQGQQQQNANQNALFSALAQMLGGAGGAAMNPMSMFGKKLW
jgi:hypothetical protein